MARIYADSGTWHVCGNEYSESIAACVLSTGVQRNMRRGTPCGNMGATCACFLRLC
jgi:hypothetical protein